MRPIYLVAVLALGAPHPASAAPDLDAQRAETYSTLGMQLAAEERFAEALDEFRRAEQLIEHVSLPGVLYGNIGFCLVKLGRDREALAAFRAGEARSESADMRARLARNAREIEARLFARLTVRCDVEATVAVGETPPVPCPVKRRLLEAGRYTLRGQSTEGISTVGEVDLVAGSSSEFDLSFPAGLRVESTAPGIVRVDDEPRGRTPLELADLDVGSHRVVVEPDDGLPWEATIEARPGRWVEVDARPEPAPEDGMVWVYVGIGAAAVAGIAAVWLVSVDEPAPVMRVTVEE